MTIYNLHTAWTVLLVDRPRNTRTFTHTSIFCFISLLHCLYVQEQNIWYGFEFYIRTTRHFSDCTLFPSCCEWCCNSRFLPLTTHIEREKPRLPSDIECIEHECLRSTGKHTCAQRGLEVYHVCVKIYR